MTPQKICSGNLGNLPKSSFLDPQGSTTKTFSFCIFIFHGLSMDFPRIIHGSSTDYPWIVPWFFHGFPIRSSMDFPWIDFPWISHELQNVSVVVAGTPLGVRKQSRHRQINKKKMNTNGILNGPKGGKAFQDKAVSTLFSYARRGSGNHHGNML